MEIFKAVLLGLSIYFSLTLILYIIENYVKNEKNDNLIIIFMTLVSVLWSVYLSI